MKELNSYHINLWANYDAFILHTCKHSFRWIWINFRYISCCVHCIKGLVSLHWRMAGWWQHISSPNSEGQEQSDASAEIPKSRMHGIRLPKNHFHAFLKDGNRSEAFSPYYIFIRIMNTSCYVNSVFLTIQRFSQKSLDRQNLLEIVAGKKFSLMPGKSGTQAAGFLCVYNIHNLCWKLARPGR